MGNNIRIILCSYLLITTICSIWYVHSFFYSFYFFFGFMIHWFLVFLLFVWRLLIMSKMDEHNFSRFLYYILHYISIWSKSVSIIYVVCSVGFYTRIVWLYFFSSLNKPYVATPEQRIWLLLDTCRKGIEIKFLPFSLFII